MPSVVRSILDVAVGWGVPVVLASLGAWVAMKHRALRKRWQARKDFHDQIRRMASEWHVRLESIQIHMASVQSHMAETDVNREAVTGAFRSINIRLDGQDTVLDQIAAQLWAARRFSVLAELQCDHTGRNVLVNAAYASLMRVGESELLGYGWKNRVVEEDRHDYEAAAEQAFREHRKFEKTVRFQRGDGTRFRGRVRLEPFPESYDDLSEGRQPLWFGSITLVEEIG